MSSTSTLSASGPIAPGIYVDEIDPGSSDMPAVIRELVRASLEQICERELAEFVTEENTPETRAQLTATLRGHLVMRWVKDQLKGQSAQEAFFLRCDHTTTTQTDLDNRFLICEVGLAPINPSEFVVFRILIRFSPRP